MDKQDVIERVAYHLAYQGCKSELQMDDGSLDGCAYRGANGTKCAIGALMTDVEYRMGWEGKRVDALPEEFLRALGCRDDGDLDFLCDLQILHDECPPKEWPGALMRLGRDYILDLTGISQAWSNGVADRD